MQLKVEKTKVKKRGREWPIAKKHYNLILRMTLPKPKQAHHRIETWCFGWRSIERVSADTTWHNSGSSLNETGLWKKDLNSWRSLLKKRNTDMLIHFCLLSVFIRNIDCWKKEIQKKTNWNELAATSSGKKWKDSLNKNSSSQKIPKDIEC